MKRKREQRLRKTMIEWKAIETNRRHDLLRQMPVDWSYLLVGLKLVPPSAPDVPP
jgi:hypothetical protein